jgi:hypothetical protein
MPGHCLKGLLPASSNHRGLQRKGFFHPKPISRGLQLMLFQPIYFKPPDISPTKVLFVKDKLPDGSFLLSVATGLSLKTSGPSSKTTNVVSLSIFPFTVKRHCSPFSSVRFTYSNDLTGQRLSSCAQLKTPPLVSLLVGWLVC